MRVFRVHKKEFLRPFARTREEIIEKIKRLSNTPQMNFSIRSRVRAKSKNKRIDEVK